ncbi:hypothetical protein BpHYR1_022212 [Brachionus plicatilis]|uniref:Uncharacterized protein n=1 Tax=Brachionus plicatilis TaxID=10195 RepID=A0A3M7Q726_BRAPC|nr:hypothetical protein BpHYR1_022212 [Brachionus plicatilis]
MHFDLKGAYFSRDHSLAGSTHNPKMILGNFYAKFDGEHFQKIIDSNIDFIKYRDKLNTSLMFEGRSKKMVLPDEMKNTVKEKTKVGERVTKQESILDLDSDLDHLENEKNEELKKKSSLNRNQLFSAMTIDAKLATNTSFFNLKSPINYNLRKMDAVKLPRLVEPEETRVPFSINRLVPKSRQNILMPNSSKNATSEEYFSLPIIPNLVDLDYVRKKPIDNLSENQLLKQKFEIFLRKKNQKKEPKEQEPNESNESRKVSKTIKKEKSKPSYTPSVKYSEVNEKTQQISTDLIIGSMHELYYFLILAKNRLIYFGNLEFPSYSTKCSAEIEFELSKLISCTSSASLQITKKTDSNSVSANTDIFTCSPKNNYSYSIEKDSTDFEECSTYSSVSEIETEIEETSTKRQRTSKNWRFIQEFERALARYR